ncbi:MAG: glycosyltransferase [archaeon]|nr:glycosyltransferase [archaeon]
MKFSIIIPMKEITEYFKEAIPYFEKQTIKDFELIILPNDNKENPFKNIKHVKIINTGDVSPAVKRNIGARKAKGDILAFIDDDAYPEIDWLEKASKDFEDKNISAIGGPSIVPKNATFFQRVSNKVYELSSGKTGIRYGKEKRQEIDDWPTCNFFVRKNEFEKTEGFDEKYWGGEDTQLCYSLLKTAKKIIYDPEMIIYHHPRKSLTNHLKQTLFWGMWRGFFMKIHPKESRRLTFFIPPLFVLWLFFGGIFSLISNSIAYLYLLSMILYVIFLIIIGLKTKSAKLFFPVIIVSILTQLFYGVGFLRGIFSGKDGPTKFGMHPKENLKI